MSDDEILAFASKATVEAARCAEELGIGHSFVTAGDRAVSMETAWGAFVSAHVDAAVRLKTQQVHAAVWGPDGDRLDGLDERLRNLEQIVAAELEPEPVR